MTVLEEPPNGGWGWMVVLGSALTNLVTQSLFSQFGLIFGGRLKELGEGTVGAAWLMNVNSMITNFSGLVTAPILKKYSCRSVALVGVMLTALGMMWSSRGSNMIELIISYSIFTGVGLGLIMPSTFLIVNHYFSTKRSQAVGLAMAGTSVGQMLMPQVIRYLLDEYGFEGTMLILGALCLNGLSGALLFHPVDWHSKPLNPEEIYLLSDQKLAETEGKRGEDISFWKKLGKTLDLDLLKKFRFVHLLLGLGLVYSCSVTYSMLLPFILQDLMGFNRTITALCMTILSASDIVGRLTIPSIAKHTFMNNRMTFLVGAILLALSRSFLVEQNALEMVILACLMCGFCRAATVVNQNLAVSEYCVDQLKLPAALGLNMVAKGFLVLTVGQFFGWVRDYTDSYKICVHIQSIAMIAVALSWSLEIMVNKICGR